MTDEHEYVYSFGAWLRKQRQTRDLTQADLAQRIGCTRSMLQKIETDARRPSRTTATRIALALDIPSEMHDAVVAVARGQSAPNTLIFLTIAKAPAHVLDRVSPLIPTSLRHQLRTPLPDFVGRQAAIRSLLTAMRLERQGSRVAAISGLRGMGGIGKTELAILVANHLLDDFPDAQIVLALHGSSAKPLSATQAMQQVIHTFTPDARLPDDPIALQQHYHSVLHGQRVLILADDARDAAQVRPLLPPAGCALLLTSRQRFTLPGMTSIDLETLDAAAAVGLLLTICNRLIVQEAQQLAQACAYLPLALRISASLLHNDPALAVETYLRYLSDEQRRLSLLRDPDDPTMDVEATLRLSYARLDAQTQRVFRQLGVLIADFTSEFAQTVVNAQVETDIEATLHTLLRRNLVMYDAERARWRLHDLLRDLARHELDVAGETEAIQWRYARAAVALATHIRNQYLAGGEQALLALAQFDTERAHTDAARRWAQLQTQTEAGDQLLIDAAEAVRHIQRLRYDQRQDIIPLWEQVRMVARRLGNRLAEGGALGNLGLAYTRLGELRSAINYHEQRLTIAHEIGDRRGELVALGNLGYTYDRLGKPHTAINYHEQYLTIARELGDRRYESIVLVNLGYTYRQLGEPLKAISYLEQSLTLNHELGDGESQGISLSNLGNAYLELGDTRRAVQACEGALAITRKIGDRSNEGYALSSLARAQAIQGHIAQASATFAQALALLQEVYDRWGQAEAQWLYGLALAQQGEREQALPLLHAAVEYEQEIGHAKANKHAAVLARLEAGEQLPAELHIPTNQPAIGDGQDASTKDATRP